MTRPFTAADLERIGEYASADLPNGAEQVIDFVFAFYRDARTDLPALLAYCEELRRVLRTIIDADLLPPLPEWDGINKEAHRLLGDV